jgi:hypothetical protein
MDTVRSGIAGTVFLIYGGLLEEGLYIGLFQGALGHGWFFGVVWSLLFGCLSMGLGYLVAFL